MAYFLSLLSGTKNRGRTISSVTIPSAAGNPPPTQPSPEEIAKAADEKLRKIWGRRGRRSTQVAELDATIPQDNLVSKRLLGG